MVAEEILRIFRIYNLAGQALTDILRTSGTTLEEVKAAVDEEERETFEKVQARIDAAKAELGGS